jgi:hypothetical protein
MDDVQAVDDQVMKRMVRDAGTPGRLSDVIALSPPGAT